MAASIYGLSVDEYRQVARSDGYTGGFGSGQHASWLNADPTRRNSLSLKVASTVSNKAATTTGLYTGAQVQKASQEINALSLGKVGLSLATSGAQLGTIGIAIDNFAAGVAPGIFQPGTVTPYLPGAAPAGTAGLSLAGGLSGAAAGFGIGQLTTLITGGNPIGAGIGGAIGGGLAGAGALAGIGIAGGPIGIGLAALAGGFIGGAFGGEPSMNSSGFFGILGNDGYTKFGLGSKNLETTTGKAIGDAYGTYITDISKTLGTDITNAHVFGGYNDKYNGGFFIRTATYNGDGALNPTGKQNLERRFNGKDAKSVEAAYADVTIQLFKDFNAGGKNDAVNKKIADIMATGKTGAEALATLYNAAKSAPANDNKPKTPDQKLEERANTAAQQYEDFMTLTKSGQTGQESTILTTPTGLLEEPTTRKKRLTMVL